MKLINVKDILDKAVEIPGCLSKMVSTWDIIQTKPVEAKPIVHAYWKKEIEDGMYWYACSECGQEVPKSRYKTDLFSPLLPPLWSINGHGQRRAGRGKITCR